jgi:glycosyltransferase 2 family protein
VTVTARGRSTRAVLWSVLRALCSLSALAWVLWRTPLHSIVAAMAHASLPLVLAGLSLNVLTRLAAAERTQMICRGLALRVSRWQNIETLFISNFYALLSPGPVLSGAVSVYRYSRFGIPVSDGLSVLLVSRAIEAGAFVAIGAACLWSDHRVPLAAVREPLWAATTLLLLMALVMVIWTRTHGARRLRPAAQTDPIPTTAAQGRMRSVKAVWHELMKRGPAMAWQAGIPAAVQVLMSGLALAILARALGVELSLISAIWVNAAVYAVVMLPISIAGVGVREFTLLNALGLLGVPPQVTVVLSLLLFADPLINAMIGGLLQIRSSAYVTRNLA